MSKQVEVQCQKCGEAFGAWRRDAMWCPKCRPIVAREKDRLRHKRYRGEPKGKFRCPLCQAYKNRHSQVCLACYGKGMSGENNPNWKGGRSYNNGYVILRSKVGRPSKGKGAFYRGEHIVVWEQIHGQSLPKGWVVHHLNGIRDDNRPENLKAMPRKQHNRFKDLVLPYEQRIQALEQELQELQQLRLIQQA